ncbi:SRPBCC family protein [Fictibacillus sp. 23RED33]|uniref:SRPBCC family protein n=1 Tax=Fictibacillus sp. 23RED33 TaxID=2745879 RepID=UPI0018CE2CEF|nr:SRPBCC family protein [Fictibacillus sp. 23RED33]MBH0174277.1 SRPBCC family protein [Fictibacillus sp. 23RED33]
MVDVRTEISINRPIDVVAHYAADPYHAPQWYDNIKAIEWVTMKPLQLGSKMAFIAYFLGRKLEYVYEVTDYVPGKKLVMTTANGPFPMQTTYTWNTENVGVTKMTLQNKGVPTGFSKMVTPFMSFMMKKANKKDLLKIKQILEQNK